MKTVRRLYFYVVAFISIEVVVWGLINLLRSIVDQTIGGQAEALAQALALIVVGMPIFLFHWLWAQRAAARDEEERAAGLRATFLYGILVATLIPLVQNVLALIDRLFIDSLALDTSRAIFGHAQPWPDSLIAIVMNALAAAYFWNVLRGEWPRLPDKEHFADVRRLYRYIWVLYSLLMTIFGAQQVLRFLFYVPSGLLGEFGRETLVNGLALLVVGAPIWFYTWNVVQAGATGRSPLQPEEHDSNLRLGILYLLALGGVITTLITAAMVVNLIVSQLLGEGLSPADFVNQVGAPLSVGVPLGVVWAYYGYWLNRHIESIDDPVRRAGMKRVYSYVLSALGLGGAFIGVAALIKFLIDISTAGSLVMTEELRGSLAGSISLIAAWLPLWVLTWKPMQAEAFDVTDAGDHARRSIVRRAYLYLALFAGVVGGMASAVALLFELLNAALSGYTESTFLATILNDFQLLVLFVILLLYHLSILRRDGQATAQALTKKHSGFKVLIADAGDELAGAIKAALAKVAPNIPVTLAASKPEGQFNALVLSGSLAVNTPEWLRSFSGARIVIPDEAPGLLWAGGVSEQGALQAAQLVRQLAEGQAVRQKPVSSGWMALLYVAAGLFGLELLIGLTALVVSAFVH
jgi:uncharacterized protein DUF5671